MFRTARSINFGAAHALVLLLASTLAADAARVQVHYNPARSSRSEVSIKAPCIMQRIACDDHAAITFNEGRVSSRSLCCTRELFCHRMVGISSSIRPSKAALDGTDLTVTTVLCIISKLAVPTAFLMTSAAPRLMSSSIHWLPVPVQVQKEGRKTSEEENTRGGIQTPP